MVPAAARAHPRGMTTTEPQDAQARLVEAFAARDVDAFLRVYEDGAALVVPPGDRVVRGRDQIRAVTEEMLTTGGMFAIDVTDVLRVDGLALVRTRWSLGEHQGRATVVVREQPGGEWRIVLDDPTGEV